MNKTQSSILIVAAVAAAFALMLSACFAFFVFLSAPTDSMPIVSTLAPATQRAVVWPTPWSTQVKSTEVAPHPAEKEVMPTFAPPVVKVAPTEDTTVNEQEYVANISYILAEYTNHGSYFLSLWEMSSNNCTLLDMSHSWLTYTMQEAQWFQGQHEKLLRMDVPSGYTQFHREVLSMSGQFLLASNIINQPHLTTCSDWQTIEGDLTQGNYLLGQLTTPK